MPQSVPTTAQFQSRTFALNFVKAVNNMFNQVMEGSDTLVHLHWLPSLDPAHTVPAATTVPPVLEPPTLMAFPSSNSPDPLEAGPHNILMEIDRYRNNHAIADGRIDITSLLKLF
jgi:hypothetical protein